MGSRVGLTLAEILVLVVALLVVASLAWPAWTRVSRQKRIEACIENLKQLHRAQEAFVAAAATPPKEQGKAFWMRLTEGDAPLIRRHTLRCPLVENPAAPECQYFGPGASVATLSDKDPLGCDEPANHSPNGREGGNVLLKSGEVRTDDNREPTALWGSAIGGKCRP